MAQTHVMVDLETFSTGNDACIVSIGAVKFQPEHRFIGEKFYVVIDPRSSVHYKGVMDADTILWWMSKERTAAREAMLTTPMTDIASALEGFAQWYGDNKYTPLWGNGAAFDNVILRGAYERCNMEVPWSYRADRCYRTIKSLDHGTPFVMVGEYHNALDDAISQAKHLMQIGNKLGINLK